MEQTSRKQIEDGVVHRDQRVVKLISNIVRIICDDAGIHVFVSFTDRFSHAVIPILLCGFFSLSFRVRQRRKYSSAKQPIVLSDLRDEMLPNAVGALKRQSDRENEV